MLRRSLLLAALFFQSPSFADEDTTRQDIIDSIVDGTRSLEEYYALPNCPDCRRHYAEGDLPDWSIQYSAYSGWGGTHGIRIWSDGHTAICTRRTCEEYKSCMSLRADPTRLELIEEQIRRFVTPATGNRIVVVPDQCWDETEHFVRIEIGVIQTGFAFSASPSCRIDHPVPDWMIDTVEMMRAHFEWIIGCQTDEEVSSAPSASGR